MYCPSGSDAKSVHVNDEGVLPAMSFNWSKDITKDFSQNVNDSLDSFHENLDSLHQNVNQEKIYSFYSQVFMKGGPKSTHFVVRGL